MVGVEADRLEQLDDARLDSARLLASLWMISASPTIAPTVMRGLSDAYGILEDDLHVARQRAQLVLAERA